MNKFENPSGQSTERRIDAIPELDGTLVSILTHNFMEEGVDLKEASREASAVVAEIIAQTAAAYIATGMPEKEAYERAESTLGDFYQEA